MFFIIALSFAIIAIPAVKTHVDQGRSDLQCDNVSISSSDYMTCLELDLVLPIYIGAILLAGVGAILFKIAG
jgi:hypothetical protein